MTRYDIDDTMISVFDAYDPVDIPLAEPEDCNGPEFSVLNAQTRIYPTKLALTRVCKIFREIATPYLYECLICDRTSWWTRLVLTLRDTGWGRYTRRVEFHLGDREVGADVFLVLACLLACPNVRIVHGFNLARLMTVFPTHFTYQISHLHTSIVMALAVFKQHPQITASLRTLELFGEEAESLPLIQSTVQDLHFPQLVSLIFNLVENQNEDLRLLKTWKAPFLQALILRFKMMEPGDFQDPFFYGVFDQFGHNLTLLSIQCEFQYFRMPSFTLNRMLDRCPNLVGLIIDTTLVPWSLRAEQVAHSRLSLVGIAHFTLSGACSMESTGRVYESILKLMNRAYFPNLIHVRILAPEVVQTLMTPERRKEMSRGIQWLKAWRNHFMRFGTILENCMGVDLFDIKGNPG